MKLGSLSSIITGEMVTKKAVKFSELAIVDEKLYVVEARPEDKGRSVIYSLTDKKDLLPIPYSANNSVHEYGGSAFCGKGEFIYFTNSKDQEIYEINHGKVRKLTDRPKIRFSEPRICGDYLFAIFEDHAEEDHVINGIMRIEKATGKCVVMDQQNDFYSGLTISSDEKFLAYFTWNFPNMSWDAAEVCKVTLSSKKEFVETVNLGPKGDISSYDPVFSTTNEVYYVSDQTGYWNIYKENGTHVLDKHVDFAKTHWRQSNPVYTLLDGGKIATVYVDKGTDYLGIISDGKLETLDLPFTNYTYILHHKKILYFIAASPNKPQGVYSYALETGALTELKTSQEIDLDPSWISIPEAISFTTRHDQRAHAFYYPPTNPTHKFDGEKPPLLLISHGGPTGYNPPIFLMAVQYWTSRGFAVCDVNYSGSGGFGRAYRNRLYKNWGIKDVDDCEDCALYLVKEGLVDKNRLTVRGGSAGGYTTLALLTFRNTFVAGTSYFGVSDLGLLAEDTHKFESRYLDKLIGDYPDEKAVYEERSPIFHTDKMKKPIFILQGTEDKVVPVEQAEKMYKALLEKKIPTAYVLYQGEGHGFKEKKNIIHSLEAELYFYQRIFGQKTTFLNPPIVIENL